MPQRWLYSLMVLCLTTAVALAVSAGFVPGDRFRSRCAGEGVVVPREARWYGGIGHARPMRPTPSPQSYLI